MFLRFSLHSYGLGYEAEYDMKNYADRGGCYPPKPNAEVDNTLRDLHNFSYRTKAEFSNCFIIYSKYLQSFKNPKFTLLSSVRNCKVDNMQ